MKKLNWKVCNPELDTVSDNLVSVYKQTPNLANDPVATSLSDYATVIIVTPFWWRQMATPMHTYLFNNGGQMAGKNVGLIVSSASSGISGVVADCKRLIPYGNHFSENLWIDHTNHSNRAALIQNWLTAVNYNTMTGINETRTTALTPTRIYDLVGRVLTQEFQKGIYIKNGKKMVR